MPKFSVVISVYNKQGFIANTLAAVLAQTEQDFEIIIINDASTDRSEEELLTIKDSRITYHCFTQNQGAGAARNKGIKLSTGQYIALLDGDDIWHPKYLSEINNLITTFPDHHVFATAIDIEDHDGIRASQYTFSNPNNNRYLDLDYFESSYKNTLLTSSSTVIECSVFETIGTYDASIKSGQDTDLWIRIGLDYRIAFSTVSCATYTYAPISLYKSIGSVKHRPKFSKFESLEAHHPALKKFLDLNRFSLAIRAKLWNEPEEALFFKQRIAPENLSKKQRFLVNTPRVVIKLLFGLKRVLEKMGIRLGVYGD